MLLHPSSRTAFWPLLVAARGSQGYKAAGIERGLAHENDGEKTIRSVAYVPYEFGQKTEGMPHGSSFYFFSLVLL